MAYEVTFATDKKVTVFEDKDGMSDAVVRERAIKLHGDRAYVYNDKIGRAEWIDIEVPAITGIRRMREVYQGGGYCLVPFES